jgi:hypothetical protein
MPGPLFSKAFNSAETDGTLAAVVGEEFPQDVVIPSTPAKTINPIRIGKIFFIVAMYSLLAT